MMKIIIKLIALFFFISGFSSCKKFLEVTPKGYTIPTTFDDYERILNSADLVKYLPTELDVLSDNTFMTGLNESVTILTKENKAYLWKPYIFDSNEDLKYYNPWVLCYRNIFQYNAIINNIDNATLSTPEGIKMVKAQAYFGRAMSYWYLVNFYSKHYNASTAATDLGVPLVTSNDVNAPLPGRGTVKETYDFIIQDLTNAIKDLPISTLTKYRATKAAGYALLARTYLFMGDYINSILQANECLKINSNILDYNQIAKLNANGTYSVTTPAPFQSMLETHPEYLYVNLYSYTFGMRFKYISAELVNMLAANDIRRMYVTPGKTTNGINVFTQTFAYYTNIGLTTTEMYLTRAECNARQNKLSEALQDINKLRENRILKAEYVPLQSTDKKQVTQWALDERRKEFFSKGLRWFDMRRLSGDPDFGFTAKHYLDDGTFISLPPNSNRYLLEIPDIALTNDIKQNPK